MVEIYLSRDHKSVKHEVKESTHCGHVQTWDEQTTGPTVVKLPTRSEP